MINKNRYQQDVENLLPYFTPAFLDRLVDDGDCIYSISHLKKLTYAYKCSFNLKYITDLNNLADLDCLLIKSERSVILSRYLQDVSECGYKVGAKVNNLPDSIYSFHARSVLLLYKSIYLRVKPDCSFLRWLDFLKQKK